MVKTQGLVLNYLKYGESSIITRIYTEKLGLRSYIVSGVRSKKSRIALFQPLTLLEMVVYNKHTEGLNRISEYKCLFSNPSFASDMQKMSIAVFISEVLSKVLREEEENERLFAFLINSIRYLDETDRRVANFHLLFLIRLTRHLGFLPDSSEEVALQLAAPGQHAAGVDLPRLSAAEQEKLNGLIAAGYEDDVLLSHQERRRILEQLLLFYRMHVEGMGPVRSVEVLKEVLG